MLIDGLATDTELFASYPADVTGMMLDRIDDESADIFPLRAVAVLAIPRPPSCDSVQKNLNIVNSYLLNCQ